MSSIVELLAALMGTGLIQKHVLKKLPNGVIPYIQMGIGMVGGHFLGINPAQGALIGLASTGAHQVVKIPVKAATGKSI